MTIYTVALEDGTVGTVDSDTIDGGSAQDFIGQVLNVHLHDENGMPIEVGASLLRLSTRDNHGTDMTALKDWRSRLGISQRAAAQALGVTLQTYQDLENGTTLATGKTRELDKRTRLACAAIERGIESI